MLFNFSGLIDVAKSALENTRITLYASLALCLPLHSPVLMQVGLYECGR